VISLVCMLRYFSGYKGHRNHLQGTFWR